MKIKDMGVYHTLWKYTPSSPISQKYSSACSYTYRVKDMIALMRDLPAGIWVCKERAFALL